MSESTSLRLPARRMDVKDFYTIETPPSSSSTSKDSTDESARLFRCKARLKLITANSDTCSTSRADKEDEFNPSMYEDLHAPLRRTLGNTKLKTRQDVRRFRKFLKRHYDVASLTLVDIDPDTMRTYLLQYLTSIRTRKGLKYDPETLRSYYLSIQRFLKDSDYPYCLRNSPQFAQCRDLIIQMRKEKNQIKTTELPSRECSKKRVPVRKMASKATKYSSPVNFNLPEVHSRLDDQMSPSPMLMPMEAKPQLTFTRDLLPSSSLPPRKRQQMKYFLEFGSPDDLLLPPKPIPSSSYSPPPSILSSDAYLLLVEFTHLSSSSSRPPPPSNSSSHRCQKPFEQLLDASPACGTDHRLMLTSLCHEWTGDIRLVHSNLRPELNSFLPHILVLNILASKFSY